MCQGPASSCAAASNIVSVWGRAATATAVPPGSDPPWVGWGSPRPRLARSAAVNGMRSSGWIGPEVSALLTSASMAPNWLAAAATTRSQSAGSAGLAAIANTRFAPRPSEVRAATVVSRLSRERLVMTSRAPSRSTTRAMACPTLPPAPVRMIVRSRRRPGVVSLPGRLIAGPPQIRCRCVRRARRARRRHAAPTPGRALRGSSAPGVAGHGGRGRSPPRGGSPTWPGARSADRPCPRSPSA